MKTISTNVLKFVLFMASLLFFQVAVNAQTFDLSGTWQTYDANGKAATTGSISHSGTTLTLNNGSSTVTATLSGRTFTAFGLTGNVSSDGNTINWTGGYVWKRQGSSSTTTASVDLSGSWQTYTKTGTAGTTGTISQSGSTLTLDNGNGSTATATLNGSTFTAFGLTGTVSSDGQTINWTQGYVWRKQASAAPTPAPTSPPPPVTPPPITKVVRQNTSPDLNPDPVNTTSTANKEQQCFNMVQGKVAYDTAGNKNWSDANVRNLCSGTTDPVKTIDCFQLKIINYNDWNRGIRECTPAMLNGSGQMPVTNNPPAANEPLVNGASISILVGTWYRYDKYGSYGGLGQITKNGSTLSISNGSDTKTAVLTGDFIQIDSWNLAGSPASNGSRIMWSNGTYWVKPGTPPLDGTWRKYQSDGNVTLGTIAQKELALTIKGFQEPINGRFDGTYIRASDGDAIGTVSANLNRIDWGGGGYWVKSQAANPISRGIIFKNESELNGVMIVKYVEDVVTSAYKIVPTQRALATGYIARGASQIVPLPLNVSPNYEIEIILGAQLTGNFWTTKLPGNSDVNTSSTCYKITGSAFNKTGGPCQ